MSNNSSLFTPFKFGPLALANRIVMAPMTRNFSPHNIPGDDVVAYYRRRAAGGVGLIITEGTCINHAGANCYPNVPYIYGEEALAGWKKVVDAVHAEGGKIAPQLWHVGAMRKAGSAPDDAPGFSPSGMAVPGRVNRHIMTQEDIDDVVAAYAQGAKDAQALGFDAVEIHGAHGYLIDQFFWGETNVREDGYGGNLAQRSRFAIEVIAAVRKAVGPDFPIIFRWSQWKSQDFTTRLVETPKALEEFLSPLVNAGVDIFHCSSRRFWEPEFEGSDLNLAGWTGKVTGRPTITVGSVGLNADFLPKGGSADFSAGEPASLDQLLQRLDNNEFDLVAVGRALLANPDWANKVRDGNLDQLVSYDKEVLNTLV